MARRPNGTALTLCAGGAIDRIHPEAGLTRSPAEIIHRVRAGDRQCTLDHGVATVVARTAENGRDRGR
jgi:hypothetical protein